MTQTSTFFDLPISEGMKQTIKKIGYLAPTPIQEKSIPELLLGKDLLGQAQTGTGKTAAFAIPLIEMIDEDQDRLQALVVCPTRELCLQVCQEISRLSAHKKNLNSVALYGGQAIDQQFRALKHDSPKLIVATPGRLFDHLRRRSVDLSTVRMVVLDEADEMLDMGFRDEIEQIFDLLPEENQRIFFSATMPKAIKDLSCSYLRDPKIVKIEAKALTVSTITQNYFRVSNRDKTEALCRVLDFKDPKLAVVFCNTKSTADQISDDIVALGFEAGVLHGDLSQAQRDRVMARFRAGAVRVLVATDVAARGLDIDNVEMVVNYHLPHDPEDYVHRIGRTGRAGKSGYALSLVEPRDNSRLKKISQFARIDIAEITPPSNADIKKAKVKTLFVKIKEALNSEQIKEYREILATQKLSAEDVAIGMLQMTLNKFDKPTKEIRFEDIENKKYSNFSGRRPERDGRDARGGRGGDRDRGGDRGRSRSYEGGGGGMRFNRSSDDRPANSDRADRSDRPVRFGRKPAGGMEERRAARPFSDRPVRHDGPARQETRDFDRRGPAPSRDRRDDRFSKDRAARPGAKKAPFESRGRQEQPRAAFGDKKPRSVESNAFQGDGRVRPKKSKKTRA